jgi:toxin ParE1/3/4
MRFRLSPVAERDIRRIARHIAKDNKPAALRWMDEIDAVCELIGENPMIGPSRDHVRRGLRLFPKDQYLVLYKVQDEFVDIIRVVHGARLWQELI